jgi:hypothetical protein
MTNFEHPPGGPQFDDDDYPIPMIRLTAITFATIVAVIAGATVLCAGWFGL